MTAYRDVVTGFIRRPDGTLFLQRRLSTQALGGWWETPGGKVEPGESLAAALRRELREELGVDVLVRRRIGSRVVHTPGLGDLSTVTLHAFWCDYPGEFTPIEAQEYTWATKAEVLAGKYEILPNDLDILKEVL
jgi:8-oxo-dGTP diphosphatase